jgi:hypothetical protein
MALPPREQRITLDAAAELTRRYRQGSGPDAARAETFHADQVRGLLAQPGCVALRIYFGRHEDGRSALVLVGVDGNDNDMEKGTLLEFGFPCPPFCGGGDALNS